MTRPMVVMAGSAVILALCAACTASPSIYALLSSQPTPSAWASKGIWAFDLSDRQQMELGTVVFEMTDEVVSTCSSGTWLRARLKSTTFKSLPLQNWYDENAPTPLYAAYGITGRNLLIQLNAPICDNDLILRGELSEASAQGTYASEAMLGGEVLGKFVARPSSRIE